MLNFQNLHHIRGIKNQIHNSLNLLLDIGKSPTSLFTLSTSVGDVPTDVGNFPTPLLTLHTSVGKPPTLVETIHTLYTKHPTNIF